jgi:hypothetical protein
LIPYIYEVVVRLKQGCKICTHPVITFPKISWKRLLAFAISIIIQPIFVNVIASLGERAADSKKRYFWTETR